LSVTVHLFNTFHAFEDVIESSSITNLFDKGLVFIAKLPTHILSKRGIDNPAMLVGAKLLCKVTVGCKFLVVAGFKFLVVAGCKVVVGCNVVNPNHID